eukprot:69085_1
MAKSATDESKQQTELYELWSTGYNNWGGQLNGTTSDVKQLEKVKNIKKKKIVAIHTMNYGATVVIHEDGDISVGGYNESGLLGVGNYVKKITQIQHLDFKVTLVSKGIAAAHVFVIKAKDGKLYWVGCNQDNQCAIEGDYSNTWMAVPMMNIDIQSIGTGPTFTLFLSKTGSMLSCGKSDKGALGIGSNTTKLSTPTAIQTKIKMMAIAVGNDHCVAISIEQKAFSWGWNGRGQCGHLWDDDDDQWCGIYEPTLIDTLKNEAIKQVDCGWRHTLLVGSGGDLFSTGDNDQGQCGDGTMDIVWKPKRIKVGEKEHVQSVKCGKYHNVLTTANNKIFVWGWNKYNQCLIAFDQDELLSPTLYPIPDMYKHRN